MDYKILLEKYIHHVVDCESVDYISDIGYAYSTVVFTPEEIKVLSDISSKIVKG